MLRVLRNVNARIRFVRWIDMDRINRTKTQAEHRAVLLGVKARDEAKCVPVLEEHIDRRLDQITSAIRKATLRFTCPRQNRPKAEVPRLLKTSERRTA